MAFSFFWFYGISGIVSYWDMACLNMGYRIMANDIIVLSYGEIDVYKSEIDMLCKEYISSLPDENNIYKAMVFNGLLLYIYNNKLKYIIPNTYNNDYKLYNDIFYKIYLPLCYSYDKTPTILQFACFVNTSRELLGELKRGTYKDGSKVNTETSHTVKNWYDTCEKDLASKAIETNGIGSIFALKANYSWRDNDSVLTAPTQVIAITDADTIKERHASASLPKKPEFDN